MPQMKFSVEASQIGFLNDHKKYGFKDKSSMMRAALNRLMRDLEREGLRESAALYAEIYRDDPELQQFTGSAISGWPE